METSLRSNTYYISPIHKGGLNMFKKIQYAPQPKMMPQAIKKDCGCNKKKVLAQRPPLKKW